MLAVNGKHFGHHMFNHPYMTHYGFVCNGCSKTNFLVNYNNLLKI